MYELDNAQNMQRMCLEHVMFERQVVLQHAMHSSSLAEVVNFDDCAKHSLRLVVAEMSICCSTKLRFF